MELKIEHLSKQFKDKTAVNDVNLTLTPGVWGLLGANGAGKTTLMRMIADIMTPTNGAVYYDGKNIRELGEVYRSKFGFCRRILGITGILRSKIIWSIWLHLKIFLQGQPPQRSIICWTFFRSPM